MDEKLSLSSVHKLYANSTPYSKRGKVIANYGGIYEVELPSAAIGSNVEFANDNDNRCLGEVVAIRGRRCMVMPYEDMVGINRDTTVSSIGLSSYINLSEDLLGRVVDFQCRPIDNKGPINSICETRDIFGGPINPLHRPMIREPIITGINAIDCFTTIGQGQRIAIMASSGIGKSVSIGMIARRSTADVNIIALVGERGREVLEFIENDLGPEGLKKSVVLVATSDQSPLIKTKAAYTATTIAEFFRDRNKNVILMLDSITRFVMAYREIAISIGEPPGPKGYAVSVFSKLPKLMERAGTRKGTGTITGIYTVLVEGGDLDEPISDSVKAIADGHIILSRDLAMKNHYPAIDVLQSISRVMNNVVPKDYSLIAARLRELLAIYRDNEDLISMGAYMKGSNPKLDKAILSYNDIIDLLRQDQNVVDLSSIEELYDRMSSIASNAENINNHQESEVANG